uniref:DDE Tnp4 domain-containing protein n=1 Tax=Timema cristinae TaxID=61476 RepID=A0A7R9HAV1_TIMCR|nr:unnamed protein product [Timema cristinae]
MDAPLFLRMQIFDDERIDEIPRQIIFNVLVALRFFATGCYQLNVAQDKVLNVSQKSVSVCIHQVCHAMEGVLGNWIQFPQSEEDMTKSQTKKYKFPGVIGAIDGDSGYPLEAFLMTTILDAMANTPDGKYTDRQCLTRSIVESTIGLLKARWRCLLKQRTLHYHPPSASKIINTCAALHNMCVRNNVPLLEEDVEDMEQGLENIPFGDADNAIRGRERAIGLQIQRRLIINHFTG